MIHSYNKTTKKNGTYDLKKNYLFLWTIPVLVSVYLFLSSPNLIKEIKNEQIDDSKISNIKTALDSLKNKVELDGVTGGRFGEDGIADLLVNLDQGADKEQSRHDNGDGVKGGVKGDVKGGVKADVEADVKDIELYLFEFVGDKVRLVRLPYRLSGYGGGAAGTLLSKGESIIKEGIENLINPPQIYGSRYQSLIPRGTKLISFHLEGGLLTLNFNEELLNDYYGEEGNKLKIGQIVSTMTAIPYVDRVIFHIEGKKVRYLDRDGLVINEPFATRDFKNIFVQYVH